MMFTNKLRLKKDYLKTSFLSSNWMVLHVGFIKIKVILLLMIGILALLFTLVGYEKAQAHTAVAIAVGYSHTCAVLADGTVECWGNNYDGQLGDGTRVYTNTPVAVSGITTAVGIAAGFNHTCAVLADGTAKCWGSNSYGQLGDGTTTTRTTPVAVSGITTAVAIATGDLHTCAVLADGTAKCWGGNSSGQLGDGTTTTRTTPVAVSGITTAIAIEAGDSHTCAVLNDGMAKCWGYNYYGQLGDGTTTYRYTSVAVSGINTAVTIAAGYYHTCAVLTDGSARCWGYNNYGQLGDGTSSSATPVAVSGITTAVEIKAGDSHSCTVLADGTAKCWGLNGWGQLGDGTVNPFSSTPVPVYNVTTAVAIATGDMHTCAVLADGTAKCWGNNNYGQRGNGTTSSGSRPVSVSGLTTAVAIVAGYGDSCAVLTDGIAKCWGLNSSGQLGDGTTTNRTTPVSVSGITTARTITTGEYLHTCAVLTDGTAKCWGSNSYGQLGDGTTTMRTTPVSVSGITTAVAIEAGSYHTCAVLTDGTAKCWGSNSYGQLGDGTTTMRTTPVSVSGITTAVAIAVGGSHSCAVLTDGTAKCWGSNGLGLLGDGTTTNRTTPVAVSGITTAVGIAAGVWHTCAVLADGTAKCWGYNEWGEIGQPFYSTLPVAVLFDTQLFFSSETSYGADGVNPNMGNTGTSFTYKVVYTNAYNQSPAFVKVHIDGDATGIAMSLDTSAASALQDGDYINGEQYSFTTILGAGNHNYYFTASDGAHTEKLPYTGTLGGPIVSNLTITTNSLPDGTVGLAYSVTLSASGGTPPYTWVVPSGLPPGLSLNNSTGEIYGTPTSAATYGFTVSLMDSTPDITSMPLSITIVLPEVCDGIDNDLDGQTDEGVLNTYYQDADGDGYGNLNQAAQACAKLSGYVSDGTDCNDNVAGVNPAASDVICDGVDNNCNGTPDDGYVSTSTSCGVGVCGATGQLICMSGQTQNTCTPGLPTGADDNCNGIDEDCSGVADDSYVPTSTSCGDGVCGATGQLVCVNGQTQDTCTMGQPTGADDNCNGIDEDCNGASDDGYAPSGTSCGVGVCGTTGQLVCVAGQTQDTCTPGQPTGADDNCNSIDEDCSGVADDDYVPTATSCGVGVCGTTGQLVCVAGQIQDTCIAGQPQTEGPVGDLSCNDTMDNDCDGNIDLSDPACINTPSGQDVTTQPVDETTGTTPVDVNFSDVDANGITTLTTSGVGAPPPLGFKIGTPPTYYEISTTASYSGQIEVCINYSAISYANESTLKLFHHNNNIWEDITFSLDTVNNIICGVTTSLSPFAIFEFYNKPPAAEAGADLSLACLEMICPVILDGSGSTDPNSTPGTQDDIASYEWFKNYGEAGELLLVAGRTISYDLPLGEYQITLVVTDMAGVQAQDNIFVRVNPSQLSLLEITKAEVEWEKAGERPNRVKIHGRVAMPVGKDYYQVNPSGKVILGISTATNAINQNVVFQVKGDYGSKWEYKTDPTGIGISKYEIDWQGAKFDYNRDIRLKSNHLGSNSTTLEIDRKDIAEAIVISVSNITIHIDSTGAVSAVPESIKVDIDDDGEIEVELPFALAMNTAFSVTHGTASYTIKVGDYYSAAVGKFELMGRFDPNGLNGTVRPATLDIGITFGNQGFPGMFHILDGGWAQLKNVEWKYKK